jgi:general secretion pathway protein D
MKSPSFHSLFRSLLSAGLILFCTGEVLAQTVGQPRPTGSTGVPTGGTGGTGGAGGTNAATTRQYINSTMVGDATITSDMDTRRIIVVTDDLTNESIKTVIASLDKPKPQVQIDVVFLQVTHEKDLDLGAEATYTGPVSLNSQPATGTASTNFGVASAQALGTTYGGFYSIANSKLNATIHMLATNNKTQILSRPSILTRSGQQASVMVGQSIPIITDSQISSITNAITNTVTYQDIGIILNVTPFITVDGNVEMIVSPQTSSLSSTTVPISTGVNSPVIDKTSADTVVVTPSDQTVIIGGLISSQKNDTINKVPLLGDIPVLGNLFKHSVNSTTKSELLIFLTPHVVTNPGDLAHLADAQRAKMESLSKSIDKDQ